jgi:tetratricopeptide (TPR) repeat protein
LVSHRLVTYDRVSRQVRLDPFDIGYLRRRLQPERLRDVHRSIAIAAVAAVEGSGLTGLESDTWAIAAVEHYLEADRPTEATEALDRFQDQLEAHGLYDQIVSLRRRFEETDGEKPSNRIALLRTLTLEGDFDRARAVASESANFVRAAGDDLQAARWEMELAALERDSGDPQEALARFRTVMSDGTDPHVRSRALIGAAQLARRHGELSRSIGWLETALGVLADLDRPGYLDRQAEALATHQLALAARFERRRQDALAFADRATTLSEEVEDRGGTAYRTCLRAALESDEFALEAATVGLHRALALYGEIGDRWGTACSVAALASIEADRSEYSEALLMVERAETLAQHTRNTRVLCLLPEVRLRCERRTGSLRSESRALVARAQAHLERRGFSLYARRVGLSLLLHDVATHTVSAFEAAAELPAALRPDADADPREQLVGVVLGLSRPLAEGTLPYGSPPQGIAADLSMAVDA